MHRGKIIILAAALCGISSLAVAQSGTSGNQSGVNSATGQSGMQQKGTDGGPNNSSTTTTGNGGAMAPGQANPETTRDKAQQGTNPPKSGN